MSINEFITSLGIFVSLLLGVWGHLRISRAEKKTRLVNAVTTSRVQWIDKTRASLSEFCGLTYQFCYKHRDDLHERIDVLIALIKMQLNPYGEREQIILSLIEEIRDKASPYDGDTLKNLLNKLISVSQELFYEEWRKVKLEAITGIHQTKHNYQKKKLSSTLTLRTAIILGILCSIALLYFADHFRHFLF